MKYFLNFLVLVLSLNFIEGAFRCDYTYVKSAKGWLKPFRIPATWPEARLRCSLEGAIVASPTTPGIKAAMTEIIRSSQLLKTDFFTGIHATFSQGDYYTIDGVPLSEIPVTWAKYNPNNYKNNESCVTINFNGELADRSCFDAMPYICYRPYSQEKLVNECGTVDSEYVLDKRTGSCYKVHTVPRLWDRAFFACSAEGGHLAIINSEVESQVIRELFAKYPGGKMIGNFWKEVAFIGFHDWNEHGEWRTIHGQTLEEAGFNKFSGGEPNNATNGEFCGGVYRNGLLDDTWCDHYLSFICEKNPKYPKVCHVPQSEDEDENDA